ncbi:diaminopimelate decarboxylase family protein [Bifidobacterium gallicum]|uniref:Diaminopimelate decarboxylase n=1 Tax=Bifidobacterium gallicum DSM 20093 = LMG 11596 TaxID=561180 RepID=D1NWN7_9BIFI|nr:diaminopimelate decarboxylase [Bifidobacterium gallicum]EFA22197.1 diaminopimelate decarboxylase [Bifidobacterium gallicum DSM 20093 = LMG 11596]KFI59067.1 diaminopimelate decarboxylase [Bifidobacterium gallicum DSM 20093 = LMG 11596]
MALTPIWPSATERTADGQVAFHGITATQLLDEFGSPLYVIDTDEVRDRARAFVEAAANAFHNTTTHVSFAGKAFLCKEIVRIVVQQGMFVDTCSLGEMTIALAAGVPGRRLVLHGNNKSDAEIELAIREGFNKIVIDEPNEAARIAAIAQRLGKRARVMLRVTSGIHAGGHEFVSTAHEDQKFGVALLPVNADLQVVDSVVERIGGHMGDSPELLEALNIIAQGPAIAALQGIAEHADWLELVGVHSHIGSNIHDAEAFIQAARRMMLLRKTFHAVAGYLMPEVDLGGGYSVAYTDGEDLMDVDRELSRLAASVSAVNRALGMPAPTISFEPGRWIVAPAGVTLYRVGTVKTVELSVDPAERTYVSVDGGMSDNIRPALYGADYTAVLANRESTAAPRLSRVVGIHCESGDIVVNNVFLPDDITRGDVLAVPVTGAYGRTMASNYNQQLIPAVVGVSSEGAHVMMRRQTLEDLLDLDVS